MDKKRILEILEGAKDDNGEIPMSLVRKAFEKIEEPCTDAVSRQAAIGLEYIVKNINGVDYVMLSEVQMKLRKMPSVQPETAKRIVGKSRGGMTMWYQCDMCNEQVDEKDTFCRGCGRRLVNG